MTTQHGGTDALGAAAWDFSTNANAAGPCPVALAALRQADPTRYPDPAYTRLRAALAAFHGISDARIVIAASASEFIMRITAAVKLDGGRHVWRPRLAYGDYEHAARAWGLPLATQAAQADLAWLCEPSSPQGGADPMACEALDWAQHGGVVVLDRAYEPLRLEGRSSFGADALQQVWQMWSPNKALGLTGVRGAYAIAPDTPEGHALAQRLQALAPSWVLGSQDAAMLQAWADTETQRWVAESLTSLRAWKLQQLALCERLGWTCQPSVTPFYLVSWPGSNDAAARAARLQAYRAYDLKLRDAASLGCPGWLRMSVQGPDAQAALQEIVEGVHA